MDIKDRVGQTLFKVIDEVNGLLPAGQRLEKSLEEVLTGPKAKIDSLGLINFILTSERLVQQDFGVAVTLTNGAALMSSDNETLKIAAIQNYICETLAQTK